MPPVEPQVRAALERILSDPTFVQADRSARFLKFIVDRTLAGEANSLKEYSIGVEVFGRQETFDPRLDAIVRVEAGRLRTRLAEYYKQNGASDPVRIDLPKGSYVPVFQNRAPSHPAHRIGWRVAWLAAAGLLAAGAVVAAFHFLRRTQLPVVALSRVTADAGISTTPTFSPDGRLIAYASDRGSGNNLDIWTQQVNGGTPVRITKDPADDYSPSFSPDGAKIVFYSERQEGGAYVGSSFGGEEKLLAPKARFPHFSPDGKWIAYYTGPGLLNSKIYVIPAEGGQPRQISPADLQVAAFPVWSPDSRSLLFVGSRHYQKDVWRIADWWTVSLNGGQPTPARAIDAFASFHFRPHPQIPAIHPEAWANGYVYFSAMVKDTTNIWRIPISSRSSRVSGAPERLTLGASEDGYPSVVSANGHVQMTFAGASQKLNLWTLLLDEQGRASEESVRQLTYDPTTDYQPKLSSDGGHLVWIDNRAGFAGNVSMIDFPAGKRRAITESPGDKSTAVLNRDGSKVAYGVQDGQNQPYTLFWQSSLGGFIDKICTDCGSLYDWSPRADQVLIGRDGQLHIFDFSSRTMTEILDDRRCLFGGFRYSPDGAWVAFIERCGQGPVVQIARLDGSKLAPQSDWIKVAEGKADHPNWGKRGDVIYYRGSDGDPVILGRRLDPTSKKPQGDAFLVYSPVAKQADSAGPRRVLSQISVGADRVVFSIEERSSNIWKADLP